MTRSRSYIATPPGATIREQLKDRGMSQKEFAARMNMSEKHVSRLINGEVQLTPEVSIRLEVVLGVPAKFWNNLEAIYREKLVKVQAENAMEEDEKLVKNLPYNELVKLEWIPKTNSIKEKVTHLRKYFEVVELGLLANSQITRIACKGLSINDKADLAFMAWVQEAKIKARDKKITAFNLKVLNHELHEICNLINSNDSDTLFKIEDLLSECGVSLIFLPRLKKSKLEGATFIDGNKVVIALSEDKKMSGEYRLCLLHELAHIVLGHIGCENGTTDQDEKEADEWARERLRE